MRRRWPVRLAGSVGAALTAGLAILVLAIAVLTAPSSRLPSGLVPSEGTYDVRILRDTCGVPHVFGRTDAEVAYGLVRRHLASEFRLGE